MNKFYPFLFSVLMCCTVFSQGILWEKSIGGNNSEFLLDMLSTADNGFLLAGATQSSKGGDLILGRKSNFDGWLWKMNANGNKEWDLRIGGDGDNYLNSIAETRDGGFIFGFDIK